MMSFMICTVLDHIKAEEMSGVCSANVGNCTPAFKWGYPQVNESIILK